MSVQETDSKTREAVANTIVSPAKLAHFVLRTSRYEEMINWYKTVLHAHGVYESPILTFITYDDEHHRVVILNAPDLAPQTEGVVGVHHIAFTYNGLGDLMENYDRLKTLGIKPVFVINHGPTTSLYYSDPDANQIELQVENFDTAEETTAFFFTKAFDENPIGVEFDPDELLRKVRAGVPHTELKQRPDDGARNLSDVKLR